MLHRVHNDLACWRAISLALPVKFLAERWLTSVADYVFDVYLEVLGVLSAGRGLALYVFS